jgi:hypothetical protein
MRGLLLVLALLGIPAIAAAAAEPMPGPSVVVRFYRAAIPEEEFSAARRLAAGILDAAGVAVSWSQCWSETGHVAPGCHRPPAGGDVILHVVPATDANALDHRQSLGFSLIDRGTSAGTVANVYADRIAALAEGSDTDRVCLLGRVIAHEIGHLLMGTNHHSTRGLMRAFWSKRELQRDTPLDWRFSDEDARTMRSLVEARRLAHKVWAQ